MYAIKIVEKFEPNIRSRLSTELIEMIIWGSKNLSQRDRLSKIDCVIMGAFGIVGNKTAAERLKRELQISDFELTEIRYKLNTAIFDFAAENSRTTAIAAMTNFNQLRNQIKEPPHAR
jgi:hypothetical protein